MRARLLDGSRDFDFGADLPPGHDDLDKDLELGVLLRAMAAGDKFLHEVAEKVLLASLPDPAAIRYRQQVLADCLALPTVVREMYAIAAGALEDSRHLWTMYGAGYQNAVLQPLRRGGAPRGVRRPAQAAQEDRGHPRRRLPF